MEQGPSSEARVQLATIILENERKSQERHNIMKKQELLTEGFGKYDFRFTINVCTL